MARLEYLIDSVSADSGNVIYAVNRGFRRRHMAADFNVSYDRPLSPQACDPAILSIPFLANVLPVIWASGEHYRIRAIDKGFWTGIGAIKAFYSRAFSRLEWTGDVVPDDLVEASAFSKGQADAPRGIFYSGGADSTFTVTEEGRQGDTLLHVIGAGVLPKHPRRSRWLREAIEDFAAAKSLHTTYIASNLNGFLKYRYFPGSDWWSAPQHGLGLPSLGIPLAVSEGFSNLIVAGHVRSDTPVISGENDEIAGNIRFAGRSVLKHGSNLTRGEKMAAIVAAGNAPGAFRPRLQICYEDQDDTYNCGHCLKCLMRALALMVEDAHPQDYGYDQSDAEIMEIARTHVAEVTKTHILGASAFRAIQGAIAERRSREPDWPTDPEKAKFCDWLAGMDLGRAEDDIPDREPLRERLKYALRNHQGLIRTLMTVEGLLKGVKSGQ